jgi:hypothetical protein
MHHYRCYFLNASSRIIASSTFDGANTQAALGEARRHLGDHECRAAAELWREDGYIGCVLCSEALIEDGFALEAGFFPMRLAKCPLLQRAS